MHQFGFRDQWTAMGLPVTADVHVRCDGELGTQVVATDKATGTGRIRERCEHPSMDGAFEKHSDIVGERRGEYRETRPPGGRR